MTEASGFSSARVCSRSAPTQVQLCEAGCHICFLVRDFAVVFVSVLLFGPTCVHFFSPRELNWIHNGVVIANYRFKFVYNLKSRCCSWHILEIISFVLRLVLRGVFDVFYCRHGLTEARRTRTGVTFRAHASPIDPFDNGWKVLCNSSFLVRSKKISQTH